ncbi:hypothetical protein [Cupriavidus campinensis]
MQSISRRRMLFGFAMIPIAALPSVSMGRSAPHRMTAAEALRFVRSEVFPSNAQRRQAAYGSSPMVA